MSNLQTDSFKSATIGRKPPVKISQTGRVVLISIMEPGLNKDEVNVVIEPTSISVELVREGIKNPVLAGKLFGQVRKEHCRVRVKEDSILVKLRKDAPGKWHSILGEASTDLKEATHHNRIPPVDADRQFREENEEIAPIEPSFEYRRTGSDSSRTRAQQESRKVEEELAQENATIKGVLDSMKAFHDKIFPGKVMENDDDGTPKKDSLPFTEEHKIMTTLSGFGVEIAPVTSE